MNRAISFSKNAALSLRANNGTCMRVDKGVRILRLMKYGCVAIADYLLDMVDDPPFVLDEAGT